MRIFLTVQITLLDRKAITWMLESSTLRDPLITWALGPLNHLESCLSLFSHLTSDRI